MKTLVSQFTLAGLVTLMMAFGLVYSVEARESYLAPAVGEIVSASEFSERAVVTSDGGLVLYSYKGDLISGFPIFASDRVFVTSPIFADVDGSGTDEIVVISRNSSDGYALHAYDGSGGELGQISIVGSVFYDPVSVKSGSREVILVPTGS